MAYIKNVLLVLFFISTITNAQKEINLTIDFNKLEKESISEFYISSLNYLDKLTKSDINKENGQLAKNLLSSIKNKIGLYSYRLHWLHEEEFNDSIRLNYLDKTQNLAEIYNLKEYIAWANFSKARVFQLSDKYSESVNFLSKAKNIYLEINDQNGLAYTEYLTAILYDASQITGKAIELHKSAYKKFNGNSLFVNERRFIALNSIGQIYLNENQFDSALVYFNKSLSQHYKKMPIKPQKIALSFVYARISECYAGLNEIDSATIYLEKAMKVADKKHFLLLVQFYYLEAKIEYLKNNFIEAKQKLKFSLNNINKSQHLIRFEPKVYYLSYQINKKLGATSIAFSHLQKYNKLQEVLYKKAKVNETILYLDENKYNKLEELHEEDSRDFRLLLFISIVVIIISIIILIAFLKIRTTNLRLVKASLENTKYKWGLKENINSNNSFQKHSETTISSKKSGDNSTNELLETFTDIIINKKVFLEDGFSLSKIAKILNTNTTYLSKAINSKLKMNFSTYINSIKVEYAIELVKSGKAKNLSVEGIAKECGFNNRVAFNSAFKNHTGVTPSFFIKNLNEVNKTNIY